MSSAWFQDKAFVSLENILLLVSTFAPSLQHIINSYPFIYYKWLFRTYRGAIRLINWLPAGKTVITSDHALKLETVPEWIVIVGSGYIGLEFSDVYTALGSEVSNFWSFEDHFIFCLTQTQESDAKYLYILMLHYLFSVYGFMQWIILLLTKFRYDTQVTFVEALDQLMPGFDPEIGKLAQRVLINPRKIDFHTGVFATKVRTQSDC